MKKLFSLRNLFLWGNISLLILFLSAIMVDQKRGWPYYQKEYKRLDIEHAKAKLAAAVTDDEKEIANRELHSALSAKSEIRQLWVQKINAVDRCITCHLGYDPIANTTLTTDFKDHPYRAPADSPAYEIHKAHSFDKFGCVVCHGGQGLATEVKAAHGEVEHWETPLYKGVLLQAACARCHDNLTDLKIKNTVYPSEIIRAKQLFRQHGCIGCHQIGGEGGPVSVDLREETAVKPLSRIDFSSSGLPHEQRHLSDWIKIHMVQDPTSFVPGDPEGKFNTEPIPPSAMPPFMLPEKDADAITAYILSLNRRDIPPQYLDLRPADPKPTFSNAVQHGRWVYEQFGCAGCHGQDARGGVRNFNYQYDVTPNLRRAVGTFTVEELKSKISNGVPIVAKNDPHGPTPPLYMPAWKDKIKDQDLNDLVSYLYSIKE